MGLAVVVFLWRWFYNSIHTAVSLLDNFFKIMNKKIVITLFALLFTSCGSVASPPSMEIGLTPSNTPPPTLTPAYILTPTLTLTSMPPTLTPDATIDFKSHDLEWCISDPKGDVSIPYIDVQRLYAISQGETLIAKLFLTSMPELFTFNRVGVPLNQLEYEWTVAIDVDGNGKTGFVEDGGIEYQLSITHFVAPNYAIKTSSLLDGTQKDEWQYNQSSGNLDNLGDMDVKIN